MLLDQPAVGEAPAAKKRGGAGPGAGRPRGRPRTIATIAQPLGPRWYVVQIARRGAAAKLREGEDRPGLPWRPKFEVEYPTFQQVQLRRGRKVWVSVPLFWTYCFVRFDADRDWWGTILKCPGVADVIRTGAGVPIPLPDADMDRMRKQVVAFETAPAAATTLLEPGGVHDILEGPMEGFAASVLQDDPDGLLTRCRVWIFGRYADVNIPRAWLGPRR